MECKSAWAREAIITHVKGHGIKVKKTDVPELTKLFEEYNTIKPGTLTTPKPDQPPVEGLAIWDEAFACAANNCTYCCRMQSSLHQHWNDCHKDLPATGIYRFFQKPVQTFCLVPKRYFSVLPIGPNEDPTTPLGLYKRYLQEEGTRHRNALTTNPPTHVKEVPPLLQVTNWHQHLAEYTKDKTSIHHLCSLMKFSNPKNSRPGFDRLGEVVFSYLKNIRKKANEAHIGINCLLMECPRTTQNGPYWRPHASNETLKDYSSLLHHFAHAILSTLAGASTSYQFPLSPEDQARGTKLLELLTSSQEDITQSFHEFISPFLFAGTSLDSTGKYSKWASVLECCLAIYCLNDDGTFRKPQYVTQVFAKVVYHCRGATLYEALENIDTFNGDPYKAVEHYATKHLRPGILSPYNAVIDYQRFATSLVLSSSSPPVTRVSRDGTLITHADKTLSTLQSPTYSLGVPESPWESLGVPGSPWEAPRDSDNPWKLLVNSYSLEIP
ncbi:hypothetical protein BD779DRAFT_1671550 [Infundibulicybe gibba]|nr:hypothetical protein BD779DRAFT_1671550 [Infundibulicybe gibba]